MGPEPQPADRRVTEGSTATPIPVIEARHRAARREFVVGGVFVVVVAIGGLFFRLRPAPIFLDSWFTFLPGLAKGTWFTRITVLRSPAVVMVGSVVAAAITVRRDLPRACVCLVGPIVALVTCELVAKPLVGRTLGGTFSYPSGSVVGAAALATVVVLAFPRRWRPAVTVVAALYALWMALAVMAMQWHLPSDAVAGGLYGVGVVLIFDGAATEMTAMLRRRRRPVTRSTPVRSGARG
jgi:membrane-associated phospholipid phosphatase